VTGSYWISDDNISGIALNVARASSSRERKQHLMPLLDLFLTYQHLSRIVHRLPSTEEGLKTIQMLKDQVRDTEHSFYLFVQSFALLEERRTIYNIFQLPLID
jgi:hypothetical protein